MGLTELDTALVARLRAEQSTRIDDVAMLCRRLRWAEDELLVVAKYGNIDSARHYCTHTGVNMELK